MIVGAFGQLLVHVLGDYWLQSDWMAQNKTRAWTPAVAHAAVYTLCFLALTRSPLALAVIGLTHLAIDHWRLARFACFAKNYLAPPSEWLPWSACKDTGGFDPGRPAFLWVWLVIIVDNSAHLAINALALRYL